MDVEERGSVYEGLLEQQPELKTAAERPQFGLGTSGERKSAGSYYTNPGLVRELIADALARAELDGIYAHLYKLSRDDFAYILDTFPIVRRDDESAYGEYRTKRLCLEAYDKFAAIL